MSPTLSGARRQERSVQIGELASAFGLTAKTLRYYERLGLLPARHRTRAGYRLYDAQDRDRLRFIVKAKAIGLTLEEIGEILALRRQGLQPCDHVVALLNRKLEAIDDQILALRDVRQELLALRRAAAGTSIGSASVCGIIEHRAAPPSARRGHRPPTLARTPGRHG